VSHSAGDILELDVDAAIGREQQGRRPVLVVFVYAFQAVRSRLKTLLGLGAK